ncbi:MAG: lipoyl(octanoyl) transferase LipB [Bacteroidetes bacterium]|nr:lipoyl(octanoyl) transferase LipB [Bacteroidota bacterium]
MSHYLTFINLGITNYEEILNLQRSLVDKRIEGSIGDLVLVTEHRPVFTAGRKKDALQNILDPGEVPVFEIERGGDVTYHGPGQLVIYPIINLENINTHLDFYLRSLEDITIRALKNWGIKGHKVKEYTGVWVGEKKIASIGISVRKWVTYHGLALNVSTDMSFFRKINPCGLNPAVMTSMKEITTRDIPVSQVLYYMMKEFETEFSRPVRLGDPEELGKNG